MARKETVPVRLPQKEYDWLSELSELTGRSVPYLATDSIQWYRATRGGVDYDNAVKRREQLDEALKKAS